MWWLTSATVNFEYCDGDIQPDGLQPEQLVLQPEAEPLRPVAPIIITPVDNEDDNQLLRDPFTDLAVLFPA